MIEFLATFITLIIHILITAYNYADYTYNQQYY